MRELFDRVRNLYGYATAYNSDPNLKHLQKLRDHNLAEFDRMINEVEAAAEQRGAERVLKYFQDHVNEVSEYSYIGAAIQELIVQASENQADQMEGDDDHSAEG